MRKMIAGPLIALASMGALRAQEIEAEPSPAIAIQLTDVPTADPAVLNSEIPAGVYAIRGTRERYEDLKELAHPFITGESYRMQWATLEPQEGVYDWTTLDNAYRQTREHDKWLLITITAGMFTPDWVYDKGAKSITFSGAETQWMREDQDQRLVVTWDPIYMNAWCNFIKALGQKVATLDKVYAVHMTGGGFIDEMHLPKTLESTHKQWEEAGISDEVLFEAWKRYITEYDKHMPRDIGLSLAYGIPFHGSQCYEMVADWAFNEAGLKGRLWIQKNSLMERAAEQGITGFHKTMVEMTAYTTVGWQMSIGRVDVGNRMKAYQFAIDTNTEFVEVYSNDFDNQDLADELDHLNRGLKENYLKKREKHP